MAIMKISAMLVMVCIANITPIATQSLNQGTFSSTPDQRISINYYSSMNGPSSASLYANGYGTADNDDSGKFILAGSNYGNTGQSESVCLEGTMGLRDYSWTVNGISGNKSITGSGKWKMDSYSSSSGSFEVPTENLTVTENGYQIPAVCGELMSMGSYNTDSQDFSYSWSGTTEWDNSQVSWQVSGSKYSTSETHSISGSSTGMNSNGVTVSPTGCLTSLKIDNTSNTFTGSGHIDGRGLQVSGRLHSGMYIADTVTLYPNSGTPAFTGSFSYYPGSSGSFYSSSASSSFSGTVFENGTWTTSLPGTAPSGDFLTGTYSAGTFQGTGKISYMDATVSGQYGASCWFTDSAIVTCPTMAPSTTNNYYFTNGSFYLCGTATPGTANKTQLMASGWKFAAKNQSNPMELTAEAITVSAETETDSMMSPSGNEKTMVFSITDSTGAQFSLSMKGYLYTYMGQISGTLNNDKTSISIMNSKVLGSNIVVTGTVMSMG